MSDSTFSLDPKRVFFTVGRDREWKKVTPNSFVSSTTDDLVDDDVCSMFLEPEKISIRQLMKEWLQESTDHAKCCEMCETGLFNLKKSLKPVRNHFKCAI